MLCLTLYLSYENELSMDRIEFPVAVMDLDCFKRQNNVSVNVLGYDNKKLFPVHITKTRDKKHHIDILLINEDDYSYYVLINDFSRLVRAQYTKHN